MILRLVVLAMKTRKVAPQKNNRALNRPLLLLY